MATVALESGLSVVCMFMAVDGPPLVCPPQLPLGLGGFPTALVLRYACSLSAWSRCVLQGTQWLRRPAIPAGLPDWLWKNQARTVGMHGSSGEAWLASWN